MENSQSNLGELIGAAVVVLGAIAFGFQKLIKGWKVDNAETSVISLMHTELERMAKQNKTLGEELNTTRANDIKFRAWQINS